jgi:hypothetical protein
MRTINAIMREKTVEPCKRNKDGLRWIVHRFPIKHGISLREAWIIDLMKPNPLFDLIKIKTERS